MELLNQLYNNTPQKSGDKSPNERFRELGPQDHDFQLSLETINPEKYVKHLEQASMLMRRGKCEIALKKFDDCFKIMRTQWCTNPEVYRLYGNLAVCFMDLNDWWTGNKCIEMALDLNPNYDFALKLKMKLNKMTNKSGLGGQLLKLLIGDRQKEEKIFKMINEEKDKKFRPKSAKQYYNFIKMLGINYATDKLTKSKIYLFKK